MKKFYTVFLMALTALLVSPAAKADITITLHAERAGEAEWSYSNYSDYTPFAAGDNEITIPANSWGSHELCIRAAAGFRLDAVKSYAPDSYPENLGSDYAIDPYDYNMYYINSSCDGGRWDVITSNPDDSRSAALTVKIAGDASKVLGRRYGISQDVPFNLGDNTFKFNPETEVPLRIFYTGVRFPKIDLDGVTLEPNSNYYEFTPTDGQTLDINTEWEARDVAIRINVPEGLEAIVSGVTAGSGYDFPAVDFKVNEDFTIKAGQEIRISLNSSDYVVNSVKAGENRLTQNGSVFSGYYYSTFVGYDPVTIDVDAQVKEILKFYIETANADEVMYDTNYGYNYKNLAAGLNEILPQESYFGGYQGVYLKAATGFQLTRVYCEDADGNIIDEPTVPSSPDNYMTLYPTTSWMGRVYKVETQNLEDLRTATVHFTITDDISKVTTHTRGGQVFDFEGAVVGQPFDVKFNPETEANFIIGGRDIPLREVKVNGEVLQGSTRNSTTRMFVAHDGDNITITADYDDVDVPLLLAVPEAAKDAVKGVKSGTDAYDCQDDVEFKLNEPFYVKAGRFVKLVVDDSNYRIGELTVDGETQNATTAFFVGQVDGVDMSLDAAPYGKLKFTVNVTDPSHVRLEQGEYSGTAFELTGTTNELEITEKEPALRIMATEGNVIKSITDADGNEPKKYSSWGGDAYRVTEGAVFNIETAEIVYDGNWVFWIDDMSTVKTGMNDYGYPQDPYWQRERDRASDFAKEAGYTLVPVASAMNDGYYFSITPATGDARMYFCDDREFEPSWGSINTTLYPSNGDVIRLYAKTPQRYDVTFEVTGDNADAVKEGMKVTTDLINDRAEWQTGLSQLFEGSQVDLTLPSDMMVGVTVDGVSLTPGEDGKYSFNVSAPHTVTVSASSAIEGLEADAQATDGAVYNMLGVKVLDKATKAELRKLAPGVYIVNGKKQVIR